MATFRIHDDQENDNAFPTKKDNLENSIQNQRRALGDLNPFTFNQNRASKTVLTNNANIMKKAENRPAKQVLKEKNIVPPVAQFEAFSVYEDKPDENFNANKKRENAFKPFTSTSLKSVLNDNRPQPQDENVNHEVSTKNLLKAPHKSGHVVPRIPFQEKPRDVSFDSPMSTNLDQSVHSMSISKDDSQIGVENEADTTIAESDRDMFFHVVEYRKEIYEYMREIEIKHRPNPRYMRKQPDINYSMRAILVDWLSEVCEEYAQQSETLHLAVSYVDRFLSYMSVVRGKLQLVGTAATFIAAKYEEVYPPEVRDFVYITDDTYNKKEVLRMEHLILKVLSFDLSTPTALSFLSLYCITHQISKKTKHLAQYIADLSLLEGEPYLQFKASVIGAASLATARHCLYCKRCNDEENPPSIEEQPHEECLAVAWPQPLQLSSGYTLASIIPALRPLARTHALAHTTPHRAIHDKYIASKFDSVSSLEARPLYPIHPSAPTTPATPQTARPLSVS